MEKKKESYRECLTATENETLVYLEEIKKCGKVKKL